MIHAPEEVPDIDVRNRAEESTLILFTCPWRTVLCM